MCVRRWFLSLILLLSLSAGGASGKDYSVPRVVIDALVRADGSIDYEEHRTYRFDGSFSEADYRLSRAGFDTARGISVREGDDVYRLGGTQRPGTYRVDETRNSVDIVWYYDGEDEERTFTITYTLDGAVIRGPEYAEFFWTYLSDRWERGTGELEVNLRFEEDADAADLHYFLRGSRDKAAVDIRSPGFRVTGSDFTSRNSLAMRAVFPSSLVPAMEVTHPGYSLAQVIDDEARREAEAEARRARLDQLSEVLRYVAVFLALFSMMAFVAMYRMFARDRPQLARNVPEELYGPPSDHPPAIAAEVVQPGHAGGRHLVATLFDFCNRGHYRIVQGEAVKKLFQAPAIDYAIERGDVEPREDELRAWEAAIVALIEERLDVGSTEIKKVFDLSKGKSQKWFSKWKRLLKEDVDSLNLYSENNRRAVASNLLLQVPVLILSIPTLIWAGAIGFLPMIISFIAIVLTDTLRHRTEEGELLYRSWKAYRRALLKGDPGRLAGSMDTHFPFAVALNVTDKRTEELVQEAPSNQFLWLITVQGQTVSPAALSKSVTSMTSSVTSAVSTGTGASVGVAGGGAGGGAR